MRSLERYKSTFESASKSWANSLLRCALNTSAARFTAMLLQMPLLFAYMGVLRNARKLQHAHWLMAYRSLLAGSAAYFASSYHRKA